MWCQVSLTVYRWPAPTNQGTSCRYKCLILTVQLLNQYQPKIQLIMNLSGPVTYHFLQYCVLNSVDHEFEWSSYVSLLTVLCTWQLTHWRKTQTVVLWVITTVHILLVLLIPAKWKWDTCPCDLFPSLPEQVTYFKENNKEKLSMGPIMGKIGGGLSKQHCLCVILYCQNDPMIFHRLLWYWIFQPICIMYS